MALGSNSLVIRRVKKVKKGGLLNQQDGPTAPKAVPD